MDFFDRQDHARRQTQRLLVMFVLAVVVTILAIYLVLAIGLSHYHTARVILSPDAPPGVEAESFWNAPLFAAVTLGTILVITVASLCKISELAAGGQAVALMLGGRLVAPQTTNLAERRLLNVVEEMSLASGVPVPPVYVLDREPGINAFAAGHSAGDAVVAVSAGCLQYLNREELQGVLGHEFSHILNGDMRLNLRLLGAVAGIMALAIIGYYAIRAAGEVSSGRDSNKASLPIFLLGLVLVIFGSLGTLLGKLIKAAINREREFLADASSVQFTRNPGGIAGALKKIGGAMEGSRIRDAHAAEVSHMFFGDAFAGSFFNLLATHPPLLKRIRLLDPQFDGRFAAVAPLVETADGAPAIPAATTPPQVAGVVALAPAPIAARVGTLQPAHLDRAAATVRAMPPILLDNAREPFGARAVVLALLLSRDDESRLPQQLQTLVRYCDRPLYELTQRLRGLVLRVEVPGRLPLLDMTVPALKHCSPQQYLQFREAVEALVRGHGQADLFEYCLRTVLFAYLDVHFGAKRPPLARYRTAATVTSPASVMLSVLAIVGQKEPEAIGHAFQAGVKDRFPAATLGSPEQCTLRAFDAALAELAQATPPLKRTILEAAAATIAADGTVTLAENELMRCVAAVLGCPLPPHLAAVGQVA
jgi:Zn-dependent protease with chaperone function